MNLFLHKTYQFAQWFGVVMTLIAMLLVSSSQGAFEECSEESVSHEIEFVLGRRDQRKAEEHASVALIHPGFPTLVKTNGSKNRFLWISRERTKINGCGSHLRI